MSDCSPPVSSVLGDSPSKNTGVGCHVFLQGIFPRDLSNPGVELRSPALQADSLFMYRCKSWAIKNAECQRTDAFELWDWRRLLRILWTARGSNLSIIKEINLEYSLEGLMLKFPIFWLPYVKSPLIGKDPGERLRAGGERGDRG